MAIKSVSFSPDGRRLAVKTRKKLRVFDVASRRETTVSVGVGWAQADSLVFSPDGRSLAVPSHRAIRLWTDHS